MGTLHLLTKEQQTIFDEIVKNDYFRKQFYFTGGTALSAVYLHHRYSDDLDIFSENTLNNQTIFSLIQEWSKKHDFTFQSRFVEVTYIFDLLFSNNTQLKVDFSYYPYKRIEKGNTTEGFNIDSLNDIAINKVVTIQQRNDVKDFVDLYYLLQDFSLWDLIHGVKEKFNIEIDPFLLATDFLKVEDFTFLPRMIKPLTLDELKSFYRLRAKDLGEQSIF
ncbi:MAG TPA: nucleotidyl transferase AbiEii/AbiGii toxin family protein [Patescibacteria group bacterium]|nr:nucleotidyl transferase AbiEii/AbiGii toxin family protein [Patescibacteria group bacterium]